MNQIRNGLVAVRSMRFCLSFFKLNILLINYHELVSSATFQLFLLPYLNTRRPTTLLTFYPLHTLSNEKSQSIHLPQHPPSSSHQNAVNQIPSKPASNHTIWNYYNKNKKSCGSLPKKFSFRGFSSMYFPKKNFCNKAARSGIWEAKTQLLLSHKPSLVSSS